MHVCYSWNKSWHFPENRLLWQSDCLKNEVDSLGASSCSWGYLVLPPLSPQPGPTRAEGFLTWPPEWHVSFNSLQLQGWVVQEVPYAVLCWVASEGQSQKMRRVIVQGDSRDEDRCPKGFTQCHRCDEVWHLISYTPMAGHLQRFLWDSKPLTEFNQWLPNTEKQRLHTKKYHFYLNVSRLRHYLWTHT